MFEFQVDGCTARVVLPARFILDSMSRGSQGELLLGFTCKESPDGHGAPNTSAPCPAHHHTAASPSSLSGSSSHPSHPSPPGGKLVTAPSPRPLSASSSHPSHPSPPGGKLDSPPSPPLPSSLQKDFHSSPQSVKSSDTGSTGLSEEDSKHVWFLTPRSQWISRQGRREKSLTPCPRWARTPTPEDTESDNLSDAGSSPPTPSPLQEDSHPTPQDETSSKTGPSPSEASVNELLPSVSSLTSSSDTSSPSSRPSDPNKDSHSSPQSETSLSTSSPPPPPPTRHPSIYCPPLLSTSLGTISPSPSLHEPSHSPPQSGTGSGSKFPPRRGRLKPWLIILTMAEVAGWLLLSTMW